MRLLALLVGCCLSFCASAANLIIIIDDMGNNLSLGQRALALPGPINFAFLPHTPQAKVLAEQAYTKGHGILLHAPMANIAAKKLGPGGLYPEMSQQQMQQSFLDSLSSIPHVQGFNNHMGSLLTQQPQAMRWIMQVAAKQDVFFVDSLTTAESVAATEAKNAGVANLTRNVFLDNQREYSALKQQFSQAVAIAKRKGQAILIGHPYPETIDFLEQELPHLLPQDIQLVQIDQLLRKNIWQAFEPMPNYRSKFQLY